MRPPTAPRRVAARLGRTAVLLAVAAAVLTVSVQVLLPALMERMATAAVAAWLGRGRYEVRLEARPPWRMLAGVFDRIQVSGTDLRFGDLAVDRLTAGLTDVRVDLQALLLDQELVLTRSRSVAVRIELGEAALASYLQATGWFEQAQVDLDPDGVTLRAHLPPRGGGTDVKLVGRFELSEPGGARMRLRVERLWIAGRQVPAPLMEQMVPVLVQPGLSLDLGEALPVPILLQRVGTAEGILYLEGHLDNPTGTP